jgi:hypothetical protein
MLVEKEPTKELNFKINMEEIHRLIRENILPRLDAHEAELYELRQVTWPVCQGQMDKASGGVLTNILAKSKFLKFLHMDEIRRLLRNKARWMRIDQTVVHEELRQIITTM